MKYVSINATMKKMAAKSEEFDKFTEMHGVIARLGEERHVSKQAIQPVQELLKELIVVTSLRLDCGKILVIWVLEAGGL
jgi:hypothetical protein